MRGYLISIVAAALVCGIVQKLLGDKGNVGLMGKLLSGVFLVLTLITPLRTFRIQDPLSITQIYTQDAQRITADGVDQAREAMADGIKKRTEAYILDKAAGMDVVLSVEVILDESQIPVPESVRLTGAVSPYAKQRLITIMEEDLGIDKEHQVWI